MTQIIETDDPVIAAAKKIEAALRAAITAKGAASLMVSGGSSPKPVYAALSKADLAWDKVTIGLVDERWVEAGQAGSNETFIRDNLLQNAAVNAHFIGMKTLRLTQKTQIFFAPSTLMVAPLRATTRSVCL